MNVVLCTVSIAFLLLLQLAVGEDQCGQFNEGQLYNEKPVAAINEFPWIARIYYRDLRTNETTFQCTAVLIGKRHLLTALHCAQSSYSHVPDYVLVGDYDYSNADNKRDCDTNDKCTPPPQKYLIRDVIHHHNYDNRKRIYDVALLHLENDVKFNDYVQPICLPPSTVYSEDFAPQYFPVAGYLHPRLNEHLNVTKKVKTVAHVIPNIRCAKTFQNTRHPPLLDSSIICASYIGEYVFFSGSILMGVNVVDSKLTNFYLLGILSYGLTYNEAGDLVQYNGYMKISANTNWIQSNINRNYRKAENLTVPISVKCQKH